MGSQGKPLITNDSGMPIFNMFHTDNLLPSSVFIDHTMTVQYKYAGHDSEEAINEKIQSMLDDLYGAPVMAANAEILMDNELDNDGVLNPGEGFSINYMFTNNSFETDALNTVANITIDAGGNLVTDSTIQLGDIILGQTAFGGFSILLDFDVPFGEYNITLELTADYINNNGVLSEYTKNISSSVNISLNQFGFPISTSEFRSSPLVVDLDGDGNLEIIAGDNNGFVHIYNSDGSEVQNSTFPFDTGNQIWGSAAAADMDRDGLLDFVITSKSKHLYIFDQNGLKVDYDANKYLMGTPAIGNLDEDLDLEVVIGGYSSSNQIFAINPDGSNVDGFPLDFIEKTKSGPALADYNGNGIDDIILATDSDKIHIIYDDGTPAPGFPFIANDKMQGSPIVIDIDGEKIIFAGSNDNNLYAINSDGLLRFFIETGGKIKTSPSFLEFSGEQYIFFGSDDGRIYAVDLDGNFVDNWPIEVDGNIGGSIVFADLDDDTDPEVIAATDLGNIVAFHLDGSYVTYFPILNDFPSSGSPMVVDLDYDNDLEIIAGSGSNLFVVDVKGVGSIGNYWSLYKGNVGRSGYRFYSSDEIECSVEMGDVSGDGNINILDLVQLSNFILNFSTPMYVCAADYTFDENINILDLVQIANYILNN